MKEECIICYKNRVLCFEGNTHKKRIPAQEWACPGTSPGSLPEGNNFLVQFVFSVLSSII